MYVPDVVLNELSEKGLTLFIEDINVRINQNKDSIKSQRKIVNLARKDYKAFSHLSCRNESRMVHELEVSILKEMRTKEKALKELEEKLSNILSNRKK